MKIKTLFASLALLCGVNAAHAQSSNAQEFVSALPATGLWWEVPYTGRVYHVDVSPAGYAHVLLSFGNAQGAASARALQGQLSPGTAAGELMSFSSPLYQFNNVGSGNPDTSESTDGSATVVFTGLEQAEIRLPNQTVRIAKTQLITEQKDTRRERLKSDANVPAAPLYIYGDAAGEIANVQMLPISQSACGNALPEQALGDAFKLDCINCDRTRLNKEIYIERGNAEIMRVVTVQQNPVAPTLVSCSRLLCVWRCPEGGTVTLLFNQTPVSQCAPLPTTCSVTHSATDSFGDVRARSLGASTSSFTLTRIIR